jgi:hypothetical protein
VPRSVYRFGSVVTATVATPSPTAGVAAAVSADASAPIHVAADPVTDAVPAAADPRLAVTGHRDTERRASGVAS